MGDEINFKVGDKVRWEFKRGVTTHVRIGVVEAVIQAGSVPCQQHQREADVYGQSRDSTSYMVRCPTKSGKGFKGKLYWPKSILTSLE